MLTAIALLFDLLVLALVRRITIAHELSSPWLHVEPDWILTTTPDPRRAGRFVCGPESADQDSGGAFVVWMARG
jgi:hypothetical protein